MPYFGHESDKGCRGFTFGALILLAASVLAVAWRIAGGRW